MRRECQALYFLWYHVSSGK